jgi:hypothetical protein
MAGFGFHPEALLEYADSTDYYLREASPQVAEAFVAAVRGRHQRAAFGPTSLANCREP